jgi:hypothetical protein
MSGIMIAMAGGIKRIDYGAGLYGPTGVDLSPISAAASNNNSALANIWIGYYRPSSSSVFTIGIQSLWSSDSPSHGQYSRGYVWIGDTAISGFTTNNALVSSNNSTNTNTIPLTMGVYYPIRIEWDYYLPYSTNVFTGYDSNGSMAFSVNGSSSVSGAIFYNTATNGF